MFEEASEVFENMFKSSFPLTFIVFIPAVLILVSPLPAEAAHEFTVYRMQQYDLQGQPYGRFPLLYFVTGENVQNKSILSWLLGFVSEENLLNDSTVGSCG